MQKTLFLRIRSHASPLWIIFEISFLRSLAAASLTAILPIYFRQFVSSDAKVGLIFFAGYCAAMMSSLYAPYIIEHLRKRKVILIALMAFSLLFLGFAWASHSSAVFILFALYQFMLSLFVFDVGLYIKHYSNYREIAQNAGKLGSLANLGWLVGPLLGSLIADRFGFEAVFLFSAGVSVMALTSFFFVHLAKEDVHFNHTRSFAKNLRFVFKDANLRRTYINNAGLGFIYSIWDYLPLLMAGIGANLPIIGITKSLMGVPQSIFEYPLGQVADKETGERKLFLVGYTLAAIFTMLLGTTDNIRLFITFFFLAAVGTSFLEMTRDSYFYRQVKEQDVDVVSVYRTSDTLPYLVGQALAVGFLSFLSIQKWFIIAGVAALFFVYNAYKLKTFRPWDSLRNK